MLVIVDHITDRHHRAPGKQDLLKLTGTFKWFFFIPDPGFHFIPGIGFTFSANMIQMFGIKNTKLGIR